MNSEPANDLCDDELDAELVADVASYVRQIRQGRPLDDWEWDTCTQEDVDAARKIVRTTRRHLLPITEEIQ